MRGGGPGKQVLLAFRATEHLRRQAEEVRRVWPSLLVRVTGKQLVVAGDVQPGGLSDTYRVRVVYDYGEPPMALVEHPVLRDRGDGQPIPHVYPGPRPCLYLPKAREWSPDKLIAETIIPWLMLWLLYYELWHATGEWQGGGEHPEPDVVANNSSQPEHGGPGDLPTPPETKE